MTIALSHDHVGITLNPEHLEATIAWYRERLDYAGLMRGKQPKLNPRQEAHLVVLFESGEHSTAELADLFSVGRFTVYRAEQRHLAATRS